MQRRALQRTLLLDRGAAAARLSQGVAAGPAAAAEARQSASGQQPMIPPQVPGPVFQLHLHEAIHDALRRFVH